MLLFTNLGSHYSSLNVILLLFPSLGSRVGSPLSLLDVVALGFTKAIPMTLCKAKDGLHQVLVNQLCFISH